MRNLFTILLGCLLLTGCLASPSSVENTKQIDDNTSVPVENTRWYQGPDGPGYYCVPDIVELKFNNKSYFVELPSMCDPNPYLYKGDPGPEIWEPIEDPELKNTLVTLALVSLNTNQ